MPGKKDASKPKGKSNAYSFFVAQCRDEQKKKGETQVFAEFGKKCGERWKAMSDPQKKKFEDMAAKDKVRYDKEMASYVPPADDGGKRKRKAKKDPNAPKRALSAFFCFCNEERPKIKAKNPEMPIYDIAKELGKRWEVCPNKPKFEALAAKEKERYAKELAHYQKSGAADAFKKASAGKGSPAKKSKAAAKAPPPEDDDEEDEDDDDEDEDEDDESD